MLSYVIAFGGVSVGLYFLSFITAMCRKIGVIWGPDEEIFQPMHVIDHRLIQTINNWDEIGIHCMSSIYTLSQLPLPPQARPVNMAAHLDELEASLERQQTYQVGCNQVFDQILRSLATHVDLDVETLPHYYHFQLTLLLSQLRAVVWTLRQMNIELHVSWSRE